MNDFINACPHCGGELVGDGYTTAVHCENVDLDMSWEADSGPWYCVEEENKHD